MSYSKKSCEFFLFSLCLYCEVTVMVPERGRGLAPPFIRRLMLPS